MRSIVLVLLCACGVDAPADVTPPADDSTPSPFSERERAIAEALTAVGTGCPGRVWPGFSMADVQVMLVDSEAQRAVLWSAAGLALIGYDLLPPDFTNGTYTFSDWDGVRTLGLSMTETAELNELYAQYNIPTPGDHALVLAFHEGFHFFGQDDFDWSPGQQERDPSYPLAWEPRYLRSAQLDSLVERMQGAPSLPAAAYFQQQLAAQHGAELEASRDVDRIEGSAAYAEMRGLLLARLGCAVDESELLGAALADLGMFVSFMSDSSVEPYDLGTAALSVIAASGAAGWAERIMRGETPVEVAIEGVAAVTQPVDPALQSDVQSDIDRENAALALVLDPFVSRLEATESTRVALDYSWMAGSFAMSGGYFLEEVSGRPHVLVNVSGSFFTGTQQQLRLVQAEVVEVGTTPCGGFGSLVVVVAPSELTDRGGGVYDVAAPGFVQQGLNATSVTDSTGSAWLCPR